MTNLTKLGLAAAIAAIAGILNMVYLSSRDRPALYLKLTADLAAGEPFPSTENSYASLPLVGDRERLSQTLVPFEKQAVVFGLVAARDFQAGDPVFYRDIAEDLPRYDTLGPFTLLSVGDRFTGPVEMDRSGGGSGAAIAVEPEWEEDPNGERVYSEMTRRLLQIIDPQKRERRRGPYDPRIVAIEAHPPRNANGMGSELGGEDAYPVTEGRPLIYRADRAIIVPIQDAANIPEVLQIGTQISFVVPAYP